MRAKKYLEWFLSGGTSFSLGGPTPLNGAFGFRVKYNTTDFSYLTSAPYTDAASFAAGSNVISVNTLFNGGGGSTVACAGVAYYHKESDPTGAGDYVSFCKSGSGGDNKGYFYPRDFSSVLFTTSSANQAYAVDSINQLVYAWIITPNRIQVRDFADNIIETLSITTSKTQGALAYNPYTGDLYLAPETTVGTIDRYRKVAGAWTLQESLWWPSIDGIACDFLFNRLINYPGTGANAYFKYQSNDGRSRIAVYNVPLPKETEEIVVDPRDGTLWYADPSGYNIHGNITDGNRGWHADPEGLYLKYVNFPHMIPLEKFKTDGSITGILNQKKITGASYAMFPVLNFTGFTNHQNLSAWQDMDGVQLNNIKFRGSDTPPSTSSSAVVACSLSFYDANGANDGWGTTIPGAWQDTVPAFNYIQAQVVNDPYVAPINIITPDELISGLNGKCTLLFLTHDSSKQIVYTPDSNRVYIAVNQANPANYMTNVTPSQLLTFVSGSPGYSLDGTSNNNWQLKTVSAISSDQTGQLIVVGRRDSTGFRGIHFGMSQNASNNHQLRFRHNASSDTPASEICIEHVDGTGVVVNRVGIADTSLVFKRLDYISTGSAWKIKINGVDQTLNVSVGSNNGNWFGDLTSPDRATYGIVLGSALVTGLSRVRMLIYCNSELDATESALVDSFITQENMLA